jgi:hypothetical protein
VRSLHLSAILSFPLPSGLPHQFTLPHELVPIDSATLVDAHDSPRLLALGPSAQFPPFPHLLQERRLSPLLNSDLSALAAREALFSSSGLSGPSVRRRKHAHGPDRPEVGGVVRSGCSCFAFLRMAGVHGGRIEARFRLRRVPKIKRELNSQPACCVRRSKGGRSA